MTTVALPRGGFLRGRMRPESAPAVPPAGPAGVSRLLAPVSTVSHPDHLRWVGPLPVLGADALVALTESVALAGRGGAAFPTARKIAAVAARGGHPVVVANCCEGDPTAAKDRTLIARSPHLVIDGAVLAGRALGASRVVLAVHAGSSSAAALSAALAERPDVRADVMAVPARYVASEASSLVNLLNTGDARPLGRLDPVWEHGVGGAPTLVDNAETLANLALLARFGATWFASVGAPDEPGTTLVTLSGAVPRPGVLEVGFGTRLGAILAAGGVAPTGFALFGGLAGTWVELSRVADLPYTTAALRDRGASRGVGSIVVLPPGGCLLGETARIARYLADASAGQCGPCMFGLPAVAADLEALVRGDESALARLRRRLPVIRGRGGCAHPDGTVAMVASAMQLMTGPLYRHTQHHLAVRGCVAAPPVIPLGRAR